MEAKRILIPKEVSFNESCLRCICSPLQYNKKKRKFNPSAVLPPKDRNRNDVSLCRKEYIESIDVCIERGKQLKMGESSFYGIVSFTRADVNEINKVTQEDGLQADIYYAPMHLNEYVDLTRDVYVNDPEVDKPDHAELRYNQDFNTKDVVNTSFRYYATKLIEAINKNEFCYIVPEDSIIS